MKIQRALISVSDKDWLWPILRASSRNRVSKSFPRAALRVFYGRQESMCVAFPVSPGFPKCSMDGSRRCIQKCTERCSTCAGTRNTKLRRGEHGIEAIDLLVVNLYPFEATVAKPGVKLAEAIEQIDIGGPAMLRSASKNYQSVTVVVDPADYETVLEELRDRGGETTLKLRERLAIKAFIKTSDYDRAIAIF
jgi:phosphoribosylaminoimidazolecarboxamide formyltransferase/IMP cyclohydrolase